MQYMRKGAWQSAALAAIGVWLLSPSLGSAAALSLQEAVDMALSNNTSLAITKKGEDTAAAQLAKAKGNKGFSVDLTSNLKGSRTAGEDTSSGLTNNVSASLPLYSGGKLENAVESGKLGIEAAKLKTEREREDIRYQVMKAYYDALEARRTIGVRQDSVDKYEAHLTNVEQLYSAGSKARIEVVRSNVELSNARQNLIKAQNSYEVDLAILRNLLNIDRDEELTLTDDVVYAPFATGLDECIDYAFQNRKDLMVDAYTLEQDELAVKTAEGGYKPSVNLTVGSELWSPKFQPQHDTGYDANISVGVGLSWNVFDGGVTKSEVATAKTARDVAQLTLDRDKDEVDLAVRQAYYNMQEAGRRLDSTRDAVNQAQDDYHVAYETYRVGEGILLDVIDAQDALSTAELNNISAQYDYARYKAEVENGMGTPLTDEEKQAAGEIAPVARDDSSTVPAAAPVAKPATVPETTESAPQDSTSQPAAAVPDDAAADETEAAAETLDEAAADNNAG
jgi:outer membrane protein TolC